MLKSSLGKIEKRYRIALFQLASQENQLKDISQEVGRLRKWIVEYQVTWRSIIHPSIPAFSQQKIILKVCELLKLHSLLRNFLLTLNRNRRLKLLETILKNFEIMCQQEQGIKEGFIESSTSLSPEEIQELQKYLEKTLNQKIALRNSVNESLLGGFVFQMDNYLLDFSLKSRLFKIKQAMKG